MDIKIVPLQKPWPWEPKYGKASQFRACLQDSLYKLEYELKMVDACGIQLELDYHKRDIRNNEIPLKEPHSNRVRLSFIHPDVGLLDYPCDTYFDFDANIRAIALTLENLRAVERYGATNNSNQYTGWKSLPPPETFHEITSVDEAAELIANGVGEDPELILQSENFFKYCYRQSAKSFHPDNGGSDIRFQKLQSAKKVLDQFFQEESA